MFVLIDFLSRTVIVLMATGIICIWRYSRDALNTHGNRHMCRSWGCCFSGMCLFILWHSDLSWGVGELVSKNLFLFGSIFVTRRTF